MTSLTWILIIVLHGWGAGVGSAGNAVSAIEFSSQQTCEAAAARISKDLDKDAGSGSGRVICVQK